MIEIENVSHDAGGQRILDDITLTIPKGGITALIGPNGAGKSTLLSVMARLQPLQSGRVRFDGLDVARTPSDALARKLAILRQDTTVSTRLSVRDLVAFGRYPHHKGRPSAQDRMLVEESLEAFDLGSLAGRYLDEISGGQRQRAMIAMAYAQATDYLLLDEPLNNLDLAHARSLMRRLRDLAERHGRTVVIVVHEINYAASHADRVVAMKDGAVTFAGPPEEVMTDARLGHVFGAPVCMCRVEGRMVALHY